MTSERDSKSKHQQRLRSTLSGCLVIIPVLMLLLFHFRPDQLAALTVIPTECWLLGGLTLQCCCWRFISKTAWRSSLACWAIFLILEIEPAQSLLRSVWAQQPLSEGEQTYCVVTLNCEVGSLTVLEDLKAQRPDLIMLQESPPQEVLLRWADELFDGPSTVIWGRDCSLLARGRLTELPAAAEAAFVHAIWQPESGEQYHVVSLRLWPQPFRLDYWNPETWRKFSAVRKIQRQQMDDIRIAIQQSEFPHFVGGDFNCPPDDPAERPLNTLSLRDAFLQAGRGWGKTITNEFPFHRIDRIWLSPNLHAMQVTAIPSTGSDHRLVRCEVRRVVTAPPTGTSPRIKD